MVTETTKSKTMAKGGLYTHMLYVYMFYVCVCMCASIYILTNLGGTRRFVMKNNSFLLCPPALDYASLETTAFSFFDFLLMPVFVLLNKILMLPLLDFLVLDALLSVTEDEALMICQHIAISSPSPFHIL